MKEYLGDEVYANYNPPFGIEITTENGLEITNQVTLEALVAANLILFINKVFKNNGVNKEYILKEIK
jgi:hypothetical protein